MNDAVHQLPPITALDVPANARRSTYPEPFASRMEGRTKRVLGTVFPLTEFGVNLTMLEPGAVSALHHFHVRSDEFVYVLEGELTLCSSSGEWLLTPGMCVGFLAQGASHHLENRSTHPATMLEIGSRHTDDAVNYPQDDQVACKEKAGWAFTTKDGVVLEPSRANGADFLHRQRSARP